jgi:hypothetical protein
MGRPDHDDSTAGSDSSNDDESESNLGTLYGTGNDTLGHLTHGDDPDSATSLGILTEGEDGPA